MGVRCELCQGKGCEYCGSTAATYQLVEAGEVVVVAEKGQPGRFLKIPSTPKPASKPTTKASATGRCRWCGGSGRAASTDE